VAPLMLALVLFGFFPGPLLDVANPAVESLMSHVGVSDDAPDVPPGSVDHETTTEEGGH
jgi:NADH-quinone oxidoreductase subunit M